MTDVAVTRDASDKGARRAQIITFYSYKGGAGRTMAVANVAWILASAGKRVLTVDWDLESPGLHRYFRPFLTDRELTSTSGVIDMLLGFVREAERHRDEDLTDIRRRHADLTDRTQSLGWPLFPSGGRIDFLSPGRQNIEYEVNVTTFPWGWLFGTIDGSAFVQAIRDSMKQSTYDYILVDSRTGVSDVAGICTKLLPDTVILCFAMNNQAIEGAARIASSITQDAPHPIRIIPVPMRVEDGEHRKLERRRNYARRNFRGILDDIVGPDPGQQLRHLVELEIPYKEYYAYEEILATFGDLPGSRRSLLTAYEDVARIVSNEEVTTMPAIPPAERERVIHQFEQLGVVTPRTFMVFAAPQDRTWKEWIGAQLERVGARVREPAGELHDPEDMPEVEAAVIVVSPHLTTATPGEATIRNWIVRRHPASEMGDLAATAVWVAQGRVDETYQELSGINLIARDEKDACDALLQYFGLAEDATPELPRAMGGARFPGRRSAVWDVPRRSPWFTGRTDILNGLRDRLTPGRPVQAICALLGQEGVGKSAIAREFAHRFGSDYDIVWWIDAGQESSIRLRLADLARRLARDTDAPDTQQHASDTREDTLAASALEALRLGEPYQRWLVIYDGADDPMLLEGERLLPDAANFGHVIVTSRHRGWDEHVATMDVGPFQRSESVDYLRLRLPDAEESKFDVVADSARDLPFALFQATGWVRGSRMPADEAIADVLERLTVGGADGLGPSEATWGINFASLKDESDPFARGAARLLELCAFLSPDGITTKLVESRAMMQHLADTVGDAELTDVEQLPRILQVLQQYSLVETDPGRGIIRMHPLQQQYVRGTMTEEQQHATRAAILRILVAHAPAPGEASEPRNRPVYAELQKHVDAAGAVDSDSPDVQRWLVNQLYFLWRTGQWETARAFGEKCLGRWRDAEHIGRDDPLTLQLARHLANALRSLGRYADAFKLDEDTLARQRINLGIHHPQTLNTAGGFAADKRTLGWFRDAWAEDQATVDGFRRVRGREHASTLSAENNLALSLFLAGEVDEALRLNREVFEMRGRVLGSEHPDTLWSQCRIAICLRELGNYEEARRLLTDTAERLETAEGPESHFTLRARRHQAVALRRVGEVPAARSLTDATLKRFLRHYGERDSATLACRMSLAADLHELGSHSEAAAAAEECLRGYIQIFGEDHPFTSVCQSNLSIILRAMDDMTQSFLHAERAYTALVGRLYEHHPYTVAAAANYANCLVAKGDVGRASELDAATYAECREYLGDTHPYTGVLEENSDDSAARAAGVSGHPRLDIDVDIAAM